MCDTVAVTCGSLFPVQCGGEWNCAQSISRLHFLQFPINSMAKLLVSFDRQNLRLGGKWLFTSRRKMRFEWLALLAFNRQIKQADEAWTTLADISHLPAWTGKPEDHIATNIGRYLQAFERAELDIVAHGSKMGWPFRMQMAGPSIEFDIPIAEVQRRLRLRRPKPSVARAELLRFTLSYVRAQWLVSQGRLVATRQRNRTQDNAYSRLLRMAGDRRFSAKLRLIACLGAVDVLTIWGVFRRRSRLSSKVRASFGLPVTMCWRPAITWRLPGLTRVVPVVQRPIRPLSKH